MLGRFFKDIWVIFIAIPQMWKMQRMLSHVAQNIKKMESKLGIAGTFLHFFEMTLERNSKELNHFIMSEFLGELSNEELVKMQTEEDFSAFISYAKRFEVDISYFES